MNECAKECQSFYKNPLEKNLGRISDEGNYIDRPASCSYCLYWNVGPGASRGCEKCGQLISDGSTDVTLKSWCETAGCLRTTKEADCSPLKYALFGGGVLSPDVVCSQNTEFRSKTASKTPTKICPKDLSKVVGI